MVYDNNPYPSKQGMSFLKGIFDLIYRPDPNDPSQLANDNVTKNRDFFNSHKGGLVNYTKRFIGGYEPVLPGESQDSGIYVCDPEKGGCGRADFMYNWEFVDAGLYDAKNWIGTVDPKYDNLWSQSGYPVIVRVRCNDYNHCNNCNSTYATANRGSGNCIYCGSSDVRGGGCGREHMAVHMVREQTVDQINAQSVNAIKPTTYVTGTVNGRMAQIRTARPFAFRITYDGLKNDSAVNNYEQAARRIPNLEIGYRANSDGINFYRPNRLVSSADSKNETFFGAPSFKGSTSTQRIMNNQSPDDGGNWVLDPAISDLEEIQGGDYYRSGSTVKIGPVIRQANDAPTRYPLSKMRFAFTYDKKMTCTTHTTPEALWAEAGSAKCLDCGKVRRPYQRGGNLSCYYCSSENLTPVFDSARPLEDCPLCGDQTDATNIKLARAQGKPLIYPRKKLVLRQEKAAGQKILPLTKPILKGKVNTYTMLAVTDDAEDGYAYEVNLDGKYTAIPIPRSLSEANDLLGISDDPSMSASTGCPKDPFIDALGNVYNAGGNPPPPVPTGVCELPDGDFVTTDQLSCDALNGDYKGDGTVVGDYMTQQSQSLGYPQSGVTFPGFSWIVCEGRTQSCYIGERRRWVDNSVDNTVYRDPTSASPGTKRNFPRFTIGPSIDPRITGDPSDTMKPGPKYLWMDPKTHVMMDIFNHASVNMATSGSSNIANHTHDTIVLGVIDNGLGGTEIVRKCKTCLDYFKKGMDLAFKNDDNGCGNPLQQPWPTIGGAANLEEAWNNGNPQKYYPGVEVLVARRRYGSIVGWEDPNTPIFRPRRIGTYSQDVLRQEIENVQGENGWWFWVHDDTMHNAYANCDGTYVI